MKQFRKSSATFPKHKTTIEASSKMISNTASETFRKSNEQFQNSSRIGPKQSKHTNVTQSYKTVPKQLRKRSQTVAKKCSTIRTKFQHSSKQVPTQFQNASRKSSQQITNNIQNSSASVRKNNC